MEPIDVFIAYAEPDMPLMERLRKQLSAAERIGLVDAWHDGEIEVGSNREEAAHKAMEEAEIVVLMLSADFFASEYLYENEMAQALKLSEAGRATVIPVLLKECTWQLTPLSNLQVLPKNEIPVTNEHWKHPDRAFKHVVDEIIRVSNQIRKDQGIATAPYAPTTEKETPTIEKNIHKTISQKEGDEDKTPLWKLALYAFGGLGAIALVSFLINNVFSTPLPQPQDKDPIGQEQPFSPPKTPEKSLDVPEQKKAPEPKVVKQEAAKKEATKKEVPKQEVPKTEATKLEPPKETPKEYEQTPVKEIPKVIPPPFATITLGNLEWSAQNMNLKLENSWCYKDASANCSKYGRLYNFDAARQLCPKGWRLPTKEEWLALSTDEIARLGLTQGGVYDRGGYRQAEQIGYYFTGVRSGGGEAWVIEFRGNQKPLQKDRRYTHWGMSCRCVQ